MQSKIYDNTFRGCTSLKKVSLPPGILSIGNSAFYGCAKMTDISIGNDVKFIGISAFCADTQLSSVDRLDDNDSGHTFDIVCDYAFANTGIKKANLSLRSSSIYTFWGDGCFSGCKSLADVHFLSANYMSKDMFDGCTRLSSVKFDLDYMAYTYPGVFKNCTALTSIDIPAKLMFITEDMFTGCRNLSSIGYFQQGKGANVNLVQKNAFYNCSKLKKITLPTSIKSVTQIEDYAFGGLDTKNNEISISMVGVPITEVGTASTFQYELVNLNPEFTDNPKYGYPKYGEGVNLRTAEDLEALFYCAYEQSLPVLVFVQYKFNFYYDEYNNSKTIYLTSISPTLSRYNIPYMSSDNYFNNNMESYPYPIGRTVVYGSGKYDFNKKKVVLANITIDLGDAVPYVDSNGVLQPMTVNTLMQNCESKYESLISQGMYEYDAVTSACKHGMAEIIKYSTMQRAAFIYFSGKAYDDRYDPRLSFSSNQLKINTHKIIHLQSSKTAANNQINRALYEILNPAAASQKPKRFGNSIVEMTSNTSIDMSTSTIFKTQFNSNKSNNILTSGFFAAFPAGTSNFSQYKNLKIICGKKFDHVANADADVEFWEKYIATMKFSERVQHYATPTYGSNKTAITDFSVGKWYYNASNIWQWAREHSTPCLFIYSLLGCGPCAIYQKNIWNNKNFQEWFGKQNFYLCGMEVEKQPLFDAQLQFCVDTLSPSAINFAKQDKGETTSQKQQNAFGEVFWRRTRADGSFESNLMTPVLVFMDANGECIDYTYHNIEAFIQSAGIDGVIQCLKSLCLYHFDGNDLNDTRFVVDAGKPFDRIDYPDVTAKNDYRIPGTNIFDFGFADPAEFMRVLRDEQINMGYLYSNGIVESNYRSIYGDQYQYVAYIGNCWPSDIRYLHGIFAGDMTTSDDANAQLAGLQFKFGSDVYKMSFDNRFMISGPTPCSPVGVDLFIPIWTKI